MAKVPSKKILREAGKELSTGKGKTVKSLAGFALQQGRGKRKSRNK